MMVRLGLVVAFAVFLEVVSGTSLGVVKTEGGLVQGKNIWLWFGRHMDVFKGIPFADVPGRFEKPKPHPGWDGVLKTTKFKKECLQLGITMLNTEGSEDCLYLNIWVPQGHSVSSDLPVMVWIYGGGFLTGSAIGANIMGTQLYNGREVAERGNVIVVTMGYRVGTLGFLSTGDSSLPGNYGLWDQQAAIAWVHRNIRAFGGDPDNVTIFGESAGGASVNFQMLTPYNKGLFKRAISQSGVALCPWAINRSPRKVAEEVALKVNCPTDENMAACLKTTDPVRLTLAGKIKVFHPPNSSIVENLVLCPVIDGDFMPDEPQNLYHNTVDIDYIGGVNDMDGHIFTSLDVPSINFLYPTSVDDVTWLLAAHTKKGQDGVDVAFSTYNSTWGSDPSQKTIKTTVVDIGTDYIFLVPTQVSLHLHAANATGRTYSYVFSQPNRMGGIGRPYPSWMGADHADDLQYTFGMPFSAPLMYRPQDRHVSDYIMTYWTNFAKTGDPNKGNLSVPVTWPEFNITGKKFLDINSEMTNDSVGEKMREPYVNLWTRVLPEYS